jgi:hypothetical protein
LGTTNVSEVMTPHPETVSPDITVLEALQTMHDHKILTLPVCEDDGTVVGLVDVMDVIYGCGGAEGWRSIFNSAMDLDDVSDAQSAAKSKATKNTPSSTRKTQVIKATPSTPFVSSAPRTNPSTPYVSTLPPNIPATLEFGGGDEQDSLIGSTLGDERGTPKVLMPEEFSRNDSSVGLGSSTIVFKVSGPSGDTHRVRCEPRISDLLDVISQKVRIPLDSIQVQYEDDEGDTVIMTSDDDVAEAWNMARKSGKKILKLTAAAAEKKQTPDVNTAILAGGAIAVVGVIALVLLRSKKS